MAKYYFNTKTGQVIKGGLFSWWNKMGPYETAEEAAHALDTAHEKTRNWDDETAHLEHDD